MKEGEAGENKVFSREGVTAFVVPMLREVIFCEFPVPLQCLPAQREVRPLMSLHLLRQQDAM